MTAPASWRLEGYRLDSLLDIGPRGEVWRGVHLPTRDLVLVKRLFAADNSLIDDLRRTAAVIGSLASPYLVATRDVAIDTEGRIAVVSDFAPGGSLASLLNERGTLAAPEIVTLLAALSHGLAALHARGIAHGAVRPTNVVMSAEGRPMLTDCGMNPEATARDDIAALARLCRDALGPTTPASAVTELLDAALSGAVDADELARRVLATGPAAPLFASVSAEPGSGPHEANPIRVVEQPPERARWPRIAASAGVLLVGLFGAVAAGSAWARHATPAAPVMTPATIALSEETPGARHVDWLHVVADLESARDLALRTVNDAALATIDDPGGAALTRDRALIAAMFHAGIRPVGMTSHVLSARALRSAAASATLLVTDEVSAYELVDSTGRAVVRRLARGPREFEMLLRLEPVGWRIVSVRDAVSR